MQYPHFFLRKRTWIALPFILITLFYIGLVTGSFKATPVSAQTVLPDLRFASSSNTVYIGRPYNSALPEEAPYTGYPSHPDAPKISITIPQLAVALSRYNLFVDQGNGVWLVKANLVVYQNARLDITSPTITELRLESYLTSTTTKKYAKIVASGGQIYIKGDTTSKLKLNSWNTLTNTVDTNYNYGRSYLAALYGARMDIIDSEASYLGWYSPNPNFPEGGVGKGGLLEGEPRRDAKAFATYSNWIDTKAMVAATSVKPDRKGYVIEWSIAFDPCVEVEPGKYWSPTVGDREVGLNIALGDLDTPEAGAGNFGNFHHEDWFSGEPQTRTQLNNFGTLRLHAKRKGE